MNSKQAISANKAERVALMTQWDLTGIKPEAELAANLDALESLCRGHRGVRAAKHCNDSGAS